MDWLAIIITLVGLSFFEIVSSIDNAIVDAEVLSTMGAKARRWFFTYGLFFAVICVRGLLPWAIVWAVNPSLSFVGSFTAMFSNDPKVFEAIEKSAPILLTGGGTFLIFLFLHWIFLEPKKFGLIGERFFYSKGIWFYALSSILLALIVWFALKQNPFMAFSAVIGSTAFFITHGFRQSAEQKEKEMLNSNSQMSDISKLFFLEVIDTTFSIDGVLGAFAFTLSVPLILIGNGVGVFVLRRLTAGNIDRLKKYHYLKNGAMYSIFVLGSIMVLESFGFHIPPLMSPIVTFAIVGYFFLKSKKLIKLEGLVGGA